MAGVAIGSLMTPAHALTAWNRKLLENYSRRTVAALRQVLPLRLALPRLEPFLAENLAKEQQKDAQVIQAVATGQVSGEELLRQLLAAHRQIDRSFLARVGDFPVGIVIRYEEIEPVRRRRIALLAATAERVLGEWRIARRARAALRNAYPRAELERMVHELMRLYALETQLLSRSLRLPGLLVPLREKLAQSLYSVMNDVAQQAARDAAGVVYRAGRI